MSTGTGIIEIVVGIVIVDAPVDFVVVVVVLVAVVSVIYVGVAVETENSISELPITGHSVDEMSVES